MNFDWTAEDRDLKARVAGLFDEAALADLEALEDADTAQVRTLTCTYLQRLAAVGYLSPGVGPSAFAETLHLMAGQEELARASSSLFVAVETSVRLFGGLIDGFGQGDFCRQVSERICSGAAIGAVAKSEPPSPEPGLDMRTTGTHDNESVIVSGKKCFVTNAPIADYLAVSLFVEGKPALVVIQPDTPGVTVGPRLHTLGYNGLAVAELTLDRVCVTPDRLIGPFDVAQPLQWLTATEDLTLVMASVGLMHATIAQAQRHAGAHIRDGKPVIAHQEIRFKLADMLTLFQTAQLLAYRAGWMRGHADPEAETLCRVAKVFTAEASEQVAQMGMQIMAGRGFLKGNAVERAYRDAKFAALAGTTSERARMSIAEDLLKANQV